MTTTTHTPTPAYQRGTERCTIVRGDGDALTIYDRDQVTIAELVAALREIVELDCGTGFQNGVGISAVARAALAKVQA